MSLSLLRTAVAVLALACAAAFAQSDRLIVATVADVVQFDPTDIGDAPTSLVINHVLEHLVARDADGQPGPELAASWTVSDDGLVWTFSLRDDVDFHDGSHFDAHVVKWHFDRVLTGDGPTRFQGQWAAVIESIDVLDDYTVAFNLHAPTAGFLDLVILTNGGFIMSREAVEANGADAFALSPVGTGPFTFGEWVPGQHVLLHRHDGYWGTPAGVAELMFRPIPEVATQVIELETGGVHVVTAIGEEDWDRLQANPNVVAHSAPAYRTRVLRLANQAPLDDQLVRQALAHAADYATIARVLVADMGTPSSNSIIPLASWAYSEVDNAPAYDPERASELLAEAGYTPGADGILQRDGQRLTVVIKTPNGRYFADREISLAVANQWRELGIDATVQVMEWAPFLDDMYSSQYQVALAGWNQSSPEPSIFADPLLGTGARANYGPWSDEILDELLPVAAAITDQGERTALYAEIIERVNDLAWFIPLYNENKVAAVSSRLEGYVHSAAFDRFELVSFGE